MRVLLRNPTSEYYAEPGVWIQDRKSAVDFQLMENAIHFNNEQQLGATHVVLAYDSPAFNLTLPISNYTCITNFPKSGQRANYARSEQVVG